MFGFEKMFDYNHDGELSTGERAMEMLFIQEMLKDCSDASSYDDEADIFGDAGLDYDELEMMDADERREVLEEAGLDPDEFDF